MTDQLKLHFGYLFIAINNVLIVNILLFKTF